MQNDEMIKLDNVSMKFNLGIEKSFSFKQLFVDLGNPKNKHKYSRKKIKHILKMVLW